MTSTPTPTRNRGLAMRPGGFNHLSHALDYAAQGQTGINFHDARGNLVHALGYAQLRERALSMAARLQQMGIAPGERIAVIATTSPAFLALFYATQYIGVVPCPLPFNALPGGRAAYAAQLAALLSATGAHWLFSPLGTLACAEDAARGKARLQPLEELYEDCTACTALPRRIIDADIPAYVQFSSGSTAAPKGVVVRQQALMANADAIALHGLRLHEDDRACSWLPLYHDMGLVGFSVVPVCSQRSVDYLPPHVFAARPTAWLELMSQRRTSIVFAPSFAWQLAARRCSPQAGLDLGNLRVAGVGGDHVRASDLDAFAQALAPAGFRRSAFLPSYGLAEATLAVCMADIDTPPRIDPQPPSTAAETTLIGRCLVGCGRPLPGTELQVRGPTKLPLPDGCIGQLWIRGPGVMHRYLHADTQAPLPDADGFLDTGDLGYLRDGELFVTGRAKELIVIRGRNLWPQDIEAAAAHAAGLDPADLAAVAIEHDVQEALAVLVQCSADEQRRQHITERIVETIAITFGVQCDVVLLPPRSLPYTTSGKLARNRAKALCRAGRWKWIINSETEDIT